MVYAVIGNMAQQNIQAGYGAARLDGRGRYAADAMQFDALPGEEQIADFGADRQKRCVQLPVIVHRSIDGCIRQRQIMLQS